MATFPTSRVDVSHLRNRKASARAASSRPINSQPAGYMSEEDRIKRAKFERRLATVNAGKSQMENTSKGYTEAPDSEIWRRGGGDRNRRSPSDPVVSKTTGAVPEPRKLFDTPGASTAAPVLNDANPAAVTGGVQGAKGGLQTGGVQGAKGGMMLPLDNKTGKPYKVVPNGGMGGRRVDVLTPEDDEDAPSPSPLSASNPPAPRANENSHSQNSSKSSKEFREQWKKDTAGAGIMKKGDKFKSGRWAGMTREEARKQARLQFNSANL